ncbi:hypothetical protein [Virgibacillus sp. DJP39]|uniref:hypothetical protein n=1 Tax=Virgibacillus sp. DJP39 TaxID=3409790 RepID=UPI003BB71307
MAMVGDSINDATVLAVADIGITLNTGTETAIEAVEATILDSDLLLISKAIRLSDSTVRNSRQNLFRGFCL